MVSEAVKGLVQLVLEIRDRCLKFLAFRFRQLFELTGTENLVVALGDEHKAGRGPNHAHALSAGC